MKGMTIKDVSGVTDEQIKEMFKDVNKLNNFGDFFNVIMRRGVHDRPEYGMKASYFRGHSSDSFELLPSALRKINKHWFLNAGIDFENDLAHIKN